MIFNFLFVINLRKRVCNVQVARRSDRVLGQFCFVLNMATRFWLGMSVSVNVHWLSFLIFAICHKAKNVIFIESEKEENPSA